MNKKLLMFFMVILLSVSAAAAQDSYAEIKVTTAALTGSCVVKSPPRLYSYENPAGTLTFYSCQSSAWTAVGAVTGSSSSEVRSEYWGANLISADGTECTDATESDIVTSGAKAWGIACPMGTSETDGYVYGNWVLPDSYSNATTPTFEVSVKLTTDSDPVVDDVIYGTISVQCFSHQDTIDTSWTEVVLLITEENADVVNDLLQGSSSGDLTGESCAGGDLMIWRYKVCDTDATPSSNCTSNGGLENNFRILGMKMEYTSSIGD